MGENNFGFGERVRLTVDAQERQPDIGHATGTVLDLGDGAAKVRWPRGESWHKVKDLETITAEGVGGEIWAGR